MKPLLFPILALIGLALAGLWSDAPAPRADFVFVNRGEVSTLDPASMSWLQDFRAGGLLYEGLTRFDTQSPDFRVLPGVASSWDVSPDGLIYTFHLRDDARWNDGRPVLADDFVLAWQRLILPDTGADYAKLLSGVRGASEFAAWRSRAIQEFSRDRANVARPQAAEVLWEETQRRFHADVGVRAIADRTLRVTLAWPVPYFLDLTAFGALVPIHPESLKKHQSLDLDTGMVRTDPAWTRPGTLVSNGPFQLLSLRFKRETRFDRNPHYWNQSEISLRSIACVSIPDGNAQVLAFRAGAVDWTTDIVPSYRGELFAQRQAFVAEHAALAAELRASGRSPIGVIQGLPDDPRSLAHSFPAFGTYFYNFNCRPSLADGTPNPFSDPLVRASFAKALNREDLCAGLLRGGELPAQTLIPPDSIAGYASPRGHAFDPVEARDMLARAGFPDGKGLPEISLLVNSEGDHALIAQSAARDWESILGVRVRVTVKETRAFRDDVKGGRFMMSRASWFGDYGDPTTFLDTNKTNDGNNDRGYSSRTFDDLLRQARQTPEPEARLALLSRAEQTLLADAAFIPVYHYAQQYLFNAHEWEGFNAHPRMVQDIARLRRVPGNDRNPSLRRR